MRSFRSGIILLFSLFLTFPLNARNIMAIGTVAEKNLGASFLYLTNPFQGFHLTVQKETPDSYASTIDWHQYFSLQGVKALIGGWGHLAGYAGIGVRSLASQNVQDAESLSIRTPIGVELSLKSAPFQLMGDVAIELNTDPSVALRFVPRLGARAVF